MRWALTTLAVIVVAPVVVVVWSRLRFGSLVRKHPEMTHIGRWGSGMYLGLRGSAAADLSRLSEGVVPVLVHFSRLQLLEQRGKTWFLRFTRSTDPRHPFIAGKVDSGDGSFYCGTDDGGHLWIWLGEYCPTGRFRVGYGSVNPRDGGQGYLEPKN